MNTLGNFFANTCIHIYFLWTQIQLISKKMSKFGGLKYKQISTNSTLFNAIIPKISLSSNEYHFQ